MPRALVDRRDTRSIGADRFFALSHVEQESARRGGRETNSPGICNLTAVFAGSRYMDNLGRAKLEAMQID
jgi:hypothetical protein